MKLFELHTTDGHREIVRSTPERLRKAMRDHIKEQRAKGRPLAAIIFCWSPVTVRTI